MESNPAGKEFVPFPENYDDLIIEPFKELKLPKTKGATATLTMTNNGKLSILYKVKCTNNRRLALLDCAGVIIQGKTVEVPIKRKKLEENTTDQLCVMYTLLGDNGGDNAFIEWKRATEQQIPTKNITINIVT